MKEFNSNNYVIEVQGSMRNVSAKDWDALLEAQTEPTPFMRHAYLSAMEESGSAAAESGWKLQLVTLRHALPPQAGQLAGAASHKRNEIAYFSFMCAENVLEGAGSRTLSGQIKERCAI